jgi:g-D-glutamyl-meso-diaminopimelate peptidase
MYAHQEADRVPMMDGPWDTTIARWMKEGMTTSDYVSYFDLDKIGRINIDYSPRYPVEVLEETPQYTIHTTGWGATLKTWRHLTSTPEFLDFRIKDEASWEEAKELEPMLGIYGPGPLQYAGPAPLSEPETQAMVSFTRQHSFRLVIAYHTQGQVIYYQFENLAPPESLTIAQLFAKVSGYTISANPGEASYAGYKDWFIQEFRRPGFTIEVGIGTNPVPIAQLPDIYSQNEEILLLGAYV